MALALSCESPLLQGQKLSTHRQEVSDSEQKPDYWVHELNMGFEINWKFGPFGDPSLESRLQIKALDANNNPIAFPDDLFIFHYGWMPGMGHGTADDGYLIDISPDRKETRELYFNMPGRWDLHFLFCRQPYCDGNSVIQETIYSFYI